MENTKTGKEKNYVHLIEDVNTMLTLFLPKIREKYADYPVCLMSYVENGVEEKTIEICFEAEKCTVSCCFDVNEMCTCVLLFPEEEEVTRMLIASLIKSYTYDFIKNRWILPQSRLQIKEVDRFPANICFVFLPVKADGLL